MSYITREIATNALAEMRSFYSDVQQLYRRHGLDIDSDLGRRNVILSTAQEKFFSRVMAARGYGVEDDGRTGQSDIIVKLHDGSSRELECKLTTRNVSGGIVLQTDYTTLERKGSLDYLYVIADVKFREFAVLHFEGLTPADFRFPSSGSRGKASMLKHSCYDRCHIIVGDYRRVNDRHIESLTAQLTGDLRPKKRAQLSRRLAYWKEDPGHFEVVLEPIV